MSSTKISSPNPMEFFNYLIIFSIFLNCNCEGGDLEYDGKLNIRLDHSIENSLTPSFFQRGDIFVKSLHSGVAILEEFQLTNEQIKLLKNLAKDGGNYRLRATARTTDGKENYYYTFVKACSLVESQLSNVLYVNLDHNGNAIAISMAVPNKCVGADVRESSLVNFNTSVEIRHMELGPIPDTATYIQKLEREREAKERGETKDNRSFLAKYWMYIVPVVIFVLLSSATNPESAGGGGGGGGGGGQR